MASPPPQTRETIREWDRRAIEEFGIPGIVLMENAGAGAARKILEIREREPERFPGPFRVLCGPGQNGGDGFVIARHLHNQGAGLDVLILGGGAYRPGSDAAVNLEIVRRMGIPLSVAGPRAPTPQERAAALGEGTIIDAILGTGLSRPLATPILEWVRAIRESRRPVIAIDIPTGLDANTGEPLGDSVPALHTITFAASKTGFHTPAGRERCGEVHVLDIGIPRCISTSRT